MDNLAVMGYHEDWRKRVLETTLKGYMKILALEKRGQTMRNRNGKCTANKRRFKRTVGKQNWFRPEALETQEVEPKRHFGTRGMRMTRTEKYRNFE